ncbi:hypothetical protein HHK36_009571 [Tetracentron sinense]|uniref:Uncharacterized protein n=1 Tax=Tetracentron sinense TaxID=13715 RepID=A0A835DIC8_TETSI|nr:hypothetical protein HHK36_009571 [Tetracentron sinense]
MVCQAASQTRFRALKHESGIAGSSTIIVRVIACFQPLQDCQVSRGQISHVLFQFILLNEGNLLCLCLLGDCFDWMEKDYGSWLHQQPSAWQSPNLHSKRLMSSLLDLGRQDTFPAYTNPYTCMVSGNRALPEYAASELPGLKTGQAKLPGLKTGQANEPHGWFYCLPRYRQALAPSPNSDLREKFLPFPYGCHGEATSNAASESIQKRFLVFDQSGNQTNLFYNSVNGTPVRHPISGTPKLFDSYSLHKEELAAKRDLVYQSGVIPSYGSDENYKSGEESEMHEDTEELNALLYSDDEYDSDEDDEETSTGHSPSTMTGVYVKRKEADGSAEEVASSAGPTKRRRLLDEEHNTLMDTASSGKPNGSWECEDDAESSCAKGSIQCIQGEEMDSLLGNKKLSRKERIRETVIILQSIIPGGKGEDKDTVLVLDEAIHYLRSLKHKAKTFGGTALK